MAIGLQPVPLVGGVNLQSDPTELADTQLQLAKNFTPRQGEVPGIRPAMAFVREVVPNHLPWNSSLADLGVTEEKYHRWATFWRPMRFVFPPYGGDVAGIFQTTGPRQIINSRGGSNTPVILEEQEAVLWMLPSLYAGGDVNGGPYCFRLGVCTRAPSLFVFDNAIYAFGGSNSGGRIIQTAGGVVGPTLGWDYVANDWETPQVAGFVPDGATVIRDRVLYYKDSRIYFSDKGAPLRIWANAYTDGWISVTGEEQESITAAAEISTSADGSPVQSVVAVWTKTRCFFLLGEPAQTIDDVTETGTLGSLQINRLNIEAGCVSQSTVVRTPYGTFWVGADDVWFMPFGALPIRVGTNIRPKLRDIPPALAHRICAEYSNGFVKIALPGAEMDSASPLSEIWTLNLNNGPPGSAEQASWWGPHSLVNGDSPDVTGSPSSGIWTFARDNRATGDGKLYSLQTYMMYGGGGGGYDTIYGMSLCGWDTFGPRDVGAPQLELRPWSALTNYWEGDIVVPPGSTTNMRTPAFTVTVAGSSGATEPNWLAAGASVTDGTVTWRPTYWDGGTAMSSYRCKAAQQSNHIEWSLVSKEYTLGDPITEKLLDGMELAFTSTIPQQLTYSTNPDQQSRSRIVGAMDTRLGLNTGSFEGFKRKQRKLMTPDPTKRFNAQTAVAALTSNAGFIIAAGVNDVFNIRYFDGLNTTNAALVIPPGFYSTLIDLWIALQDAMDVSYATESSILNDGGVWRSRVGFRASTAGAEAFGMGGHTLLASYFGFLRSQQHTDNRLDTSQFFFGLASPEYKQVSDFQINSLNLRFKAFGRRAT